MSTALLDRFNQNVEAFVNDYVAQSKDDKEKNILASSLQLIVKGEEAGDLKHLFQMIHDFARRFFLFFLACRGEAVRVKNDGELGTVSESELSERLNEAVGRRLSPADREKFRRLYYLLIAKDGAQYSPRAGGLGR